MDGFSSLLGIGVILAGIIGVIFALVVIAAIVWAIIYFSKRKNNNENKQ